MNYHRRTEEMNPIDSDYLAEMKEKGTYDYFTFPGSYELFYITAANRILCPDCANNNPELCRDETDKEWNIVAYAVHWEGKPLECDNCNKTIESEYGDPEEEEL
jgi:hypothetical protein